MFQFLTEQLVEYAQRNYTGCAKRTSENGNVYQCMAVYDSVWQCMTIYESV